MSASIKPVQSRIKLVWTGECLGVQRKHPTHYAQRVNGKIYAYPALPEKTPIIIPKSATEPSVVGKFSFYQAQIWQATCQNVPIRQIFAGDAKRGNGLFSHAKGDNGSFRHDMPLEPCNTFMAIDAFKITDKVYQHDTFMRECIEELIKVFAFIEVTAIDTEKVELPEKMLVDMKFVKVSDTPFVIRDNCGYYSELWGVPALPPPPAGQILPLPPHLLQ